MAGDAAAAGVRPLGKAVHSHQQRSLEELQRLVSTEVEAKELALRHPALVRDLQAALRSLGAVESSLRALGRHVAQGEATAYRRDPRMRGDSSGSLERLGVVQLSSPKVLSGSGLGIGSCGDDSSGSDGELGISGWEGTVRKGARGTILPTDIATLPSLASASLQSSAGAGEAGEEEDFDADDWGLEEGFADAIVEKDEAQVHALPALTAGEELAIRSAADQHRHLRHWERTSPALDPNLIRRMGIVLVAANAKRIAKQQKEARRQAGIVFEEMDLIREQPRRRSPVARHSATRGGSGAAIANEDDFADGIGDDDLELSLANFGNKGKSSSSTESGSEDWDAAFDDDFSDSEAATPQQGTLSLPSVDGNTAGESGGEFDDDFDFPDD